MSFVYHRCPEHMTGTIIYPMSQLMEIYPDLFIERERHHQHQPRVLQGSIPHLGCFWNDVLHCTAVPPQRISEALHKIGYTIKLKYFEIPAEKLEKEKTIVFLNPPRELGAPTKYTDFIEYNFADVEKFAYIPDRPVDPHKAIPTSDEFLLNYGAPYILYKGILSIEGLRVIEL